MPSHTSRHRQDIGAYHYYVQEQMDVFWRKRATSHRRILFILGHGFDPRCTTALKVAAETLNRAQQFDTCCVRFTNLFDGQLDENLGYAEECLTQIRYTIDSLRGARHKHFEIEVSLFDHAKELVGDALLLKEFNDAFGRDLPSYSDLIVDISAFPRTLMYCLLLHLWTRRKVGQNIFVVYTDLVWQPLISEDDYSAPTYLRNGPLPQEDVPKLWVPVLGGRMERFNNIYDFLKPKAVFPIVPFPAAHPRFGDEVILGSRGHLEAKWNVSFENFMYASGEVPFDVLRKIFEFVEERRTMNHRCSIIVSALSGRSLSLGVALASFILDLPICHAQPTTYKIERHVRDQLKIASQRASPILYWLAGELYD